MQQKFLDDVAGPDVGVIYYQYTTSLYLSDDVKKIEECDRKRVASINESPFENGW
jgi:hypothetical protein